ncbi:hypothetical protein JCM11491_001939 [Sporobolomyces phaffii]
MGKTRRQQAAVSESSSDDGEDGEVYVVEAIKASRFDTLTGHWRYLIKWQGYDDDEATWEPAANLNCPDLLAAYEAEQQRKGLPTSSKPQQPKSARAGRKSDTAKSPSTASTKAKPPTPKGKGKATAPIENEDEDDEANGATMAELDERRRAAKKKAAQQPRVSNVRAEDAVALKWENKATSKASASKAAEVAPAKSSPRKEKSKEVTAPAANGEQTRKRTRSPTKRGSRGGTATEASASRDSNGTVRSHPEVFGCTVNHAVNRAVNRAVNCTINRAVNRAVNCTINRAVNCTINRAVNCTINCTINRAFNRASNCAINYAISRSVNVDNLGCRADTFSAPVVFPKAFAIRAMQFKRRPPIAPHAPLIQSKSPSDSSDQGAVSNSTAVAKAPPVAEDSAQSAQSDATPKATSTSTKPSVRFADEADSTTTAEESPMEDDYAAAAASRAAAAAEREQSLANLETRLTSSEYYRRTPVFQQRSIAAACAEAVRISQGTVLRMKGRGVAIICDSRDLMVSGEGIALGLLLMLVGAIMPKQLSEVTVVCVHRRETLVPIEKMYVELINTKTHHVEFLHFGDNKPVAPILISGFLIVPSLSALQQGMAVESFCLNTHRANVRNCTVLAHPASIVLARTRLPQWQKIMHTLGTSSIPIVEKKDLSLTSPFVVLDKTSYLASGEPKVALPAVTSQSEIAEITNLLCRKREEDPSRWRRFIIVVDQVDSDASEAAKERGVELCTWVGLSELTRECLF